MLDSSRKTVPRGVYCFQKLQNYHSLSILHQADNRIPVASGLGSSSVAVVVGIAGATAVALNEAGPSLIACATALHDQINDSIIEAFNVVGLACRSWMLAIDRKGLRITIE